MTERQKEFFDAVKNHLNDDNAIDDTLAANMAILMDTVEKANHHVNEHGQVLAQTGDKGQTRYVPNPSVVQRDAAIKNINVHVRTLKIETQVLEEESELAKFLKR